ncbi:hypothetical protein AB5I39_14945 [Sphingomonas sp. MMS24-J45]|uniref:hypothetical protein n=1 Tax=Sphingomonas sp. MMS24-J45 TaxID=3238806 RepID=UPI00384C6FAA
MADNPNFPISTAAISWFDGSGGLHIRVYSSDGYTITERCSDSGGPGWTTGSFSQPGSAVSATVWVSGGEAQIRIYCTSADQTTEWANTSSGWVKGTYTTT